MLSPAAQAVAASAPLAKKARHAGAPGAVVAATSAAERAYVPPLALERVTLLDNKLARPGDKKPLWFVSPPMPVIYPKVVLEGSAINVELQYAPKERHMAKFEVKLGVGVDAEAAARGLMSRAHQLAFVEWVHEAAHELLGKCFDEPPADKEGKWRKIRHEKLNLARTERARELNGNKASGAHTKYTVAHEEKTDAALAAQMEARARELMQDGAKNMPPDVADYDTETLRPLDPERKGWLSLTGRRAVWRVGNYDSGPRDPAGRYDHPKVATPRELTSSAENWPRIFALMHGHKYLYNPFEYVDGAKRPYTVPQVELAGLRDPATGAPLLVRDPTWSPIAVANTTAFARMSFAMEAFVGGEAEYGVRLVPSKNIIVYRVVQGSMREVLGIGGGDEDGDGQGGEDIYSGAQWDAEVQGGEAARLAAAAPPTRVLGLPAPPPGAFDANNNNGTNAAPLALTDADMVAAAERAEAAAAAAAAESVPAPAASKPRKKRLAAKRKRDDDDSLSFSDNEAADDDSSDSMGAAGTREIGGGVD